MADSKRMRKYRPTPKLSGGAMNKPGVRRPKPGNSTARTLTKMAKRKPKRAM